MTFTASVAAFTSLSSRSVRSSCSCLAPSSCSCVCAATALAGPCANEVFFKPFFRDPRPLQAASLSYGCPPPPLRAPPTPLAYYTNIYRIDYVI